MSVFSDLMGGVSEAVNSVFGSSCSYELKSGSIVTTNIVVTKNKEVLDQFNVLVGYRTEGKILKSDVPSPKEGERFIDDDDSVWEVSLITSETSSCTYVDLIEV